MTRAVILAAGVGSRFKSNRPKCMIQLDNGKTIIENQIYNLYSMGVKDITVVVGYKFYMIMEHVVEITEPFDDLEVKFILNERFNSTNTCKSLLKGLVAEDHGSLDSPGPSVIWMNGDVVFPAKVISELLTHERYQDSSVGMLICNTENVSDEEIKYITVDGSIVELSKQVPITHAEGEAVGINFIHDQLIPEFIHALRKCDDQDYFEKAIEFMIKDGFKFIPVITKTKCVEIDFEEDLLNL